MLRRATSLFILTLYLLGIMRLEAAAESSRPVAALRSEYLRLRNNDPLGDGADYKQAWSKLASQMQTVLLKSRAREDLARLRIYSADTDLRLFYITQQKPYLTRAAATLEPLVSARNQDGEQGAALVLLGDIEITKGASASNVRAIYQRAAESSGPTRQIAQQRLQSLRNGTFQVLMPSNDLETPRPVKSTQFNRRWSLRPVVIDPGHGGYDAGAVGHSGALEKDITLDIARRVRTLLVKRYSIPVLLTREDDDFVPLARRTSYANAKNASAFISLHVNASADHDGRGLEVYYLDNTNDAASRKLAERENGVAAAGDLDDLSFMLSDLIQSGKLEDSMQLTRTLNNSVKATVAPTYRQARFLGVKKAPFFVLVGAHMPCSLIEMFFVDHPEDGAKLSRDQFRDSLANGIAYGIANFLLSDAKHSTPTQLRAAIR